MYLDEATASLEAIGANVSTLLSRVVGTLAAGTHNPQSGDAYARLGAPAGASVVADIATRLATGGYTAPDNAGIAAIKAKSDNLPADTNTLLTSTGIKVSSIANGVIAAATFASGALDAVWSVASRTLTAISDSSGITTLLSRIGGVLTLSGGKVTVGTNDDKTGYALAVAPPTAEQVRSEMDAASTKLANLDATISSRLAAADYGEVDLSSVLLAIGALHDFDPATDTVARVNLVDTTTTLTNAPDVPTEDEIAAAVWSYVTRTITSGGITAQQVWEYVSSTLPSGAEAMLALVSAIKSRIEEQVSTGPIIIMPAPPTDTQTAVYARCWNPDGSAAEGATIYVRMLKTESGSDGDAYSSEPVIAISGSDGLATFNIPRGAGLTFQVRRGKTGKWVSFSGVDAEQMELPDVLGP